MKLILPLFFVLASCKVNLLISPQKKFPVSSRYNKPLLTSYMAAVKKGNGKPKFSFNNFDPKDGKMFLDEWSDIVSLMEERDLIALYRNIYHILENGYFFEPVPTNFLGSLKKQNGMSILKKWKDFREFGKGSFDYKYKDLSTEDRLMLEELSEKIKGCLSDQTIAKINLYMIDVSDSDSNIEDCKERKIQKFIDNSDGEISREAFSFV